MITSEDLCSIRLFDQLDDLELKTIALAAADIHLITDQFLVHEGELPDFYMLLSGELELTKWLGDTEEVIRSFLPGDFFGEVPLLLGTTVFVNLRATGPVRVARLDGADFLELIMRSEKLAALILQTMADRVTAISEVSVSKPRPRILLVGDSADLACYELRQFLAGNRLRFQWLDPHNPASANSIPEPVRQNVHPSVCFPDGTFLHRPTMREVADRAGLQTAPHTDYYDVVIIGGGPAGLAAAVYGASEGLKTLLLERQAPGDRPERRRASKTISASRPASPAASLAPALSIRRSGSAPRSSFRGRSAPSRRRPAIRPSCLTAPTRSARGLSCWQPAFRGEDWGFPAPRRLSDAVSTTGAARTEAIGVRGKAVYLIGGGNSAGQAAIFFADYASEVTLLIRGASIEAGMSQYLIDQIRTKDNIKVCLRSCVIEAHGSEQLEAITVQTDACTAEGARDPSKPPTTERLDATSLFVFIGADAVTDWLPDGIGRDKLGYVLTGPDAHSAAEWPLERDPYLLETTVPGIFAAGDVRHASINSVAAGVGEGSMAIAFIHQYLASLTA